MQQGIPDTLFGPAAEAHIDRVPFAVPLVHVAPGAADPQHVKHSIEEEPVIARGPRPTAALRRQQWPDQFPLRIRQIPATHDCSSKSSLESEGGGLGNPFCQHGLDLLISLCETADNLGRSIEKFEDDVDGSETLQLLTNLDSIVGRLVGNKPKSLGLHPFVYFYTSKGRHYPPLMLAMFSVIAKHVKNNNKSWFYDFTINRSSIERLLLEHKGIITLLISALGSKQRVDGGIKVLDFIFEQASTENPAVDPNQIAIILGLESRLYTIQSKPGSDFSEDAKSSAFLRQAFAQALICPICEGYLDPSKSASYDHIIRKQDGGDGSDSNCQITHPYCNSSIKN